MKLKLLYQTLQTQLRHSGLQPGMEAATTIAVISLAAVGLLAGLKQIGKIEGLELLAYDQMVQLRGDDLPDQRLLIVGITERDIEAFQTTPPDQVLADAMAILQTHHPRVIGLDLHRNAPHPPGWESLLTQMQAKNVVVITKLGDTAATAIPPPPQISPDRVGFNDLLLDPDNTVRRNLLIGSNQDGVFYSFALRTALAALAQQGIQPRGSDRNPDWLQLGQVVFKPLTARSGGYQQIDSGGYQILLDYRGADPVAPHLSLTAVLTQQFDPALVQDRVVLIGSTAGSLKDLFVTPYSSGRQRDVKMAGVEIHAQMVSQILDLAQGNRPFFWFWPQWAELLWDLGWAIAGATVAWFIRRPLLVGLGSACLIGGVGGLGYLCFLHSGWIPIISPVLALGLSTGTMITYRGQQAQQRQQMVMSLLGQSTSPEIAQALWESRDRLLKSGKLPGQRLVATMLFADIQGFSPLAEKLPPEALMDWLNQYLDAMVAVVKGHRGIVNKFTGDGLLAVFGVPVPRTTAAEIAQDAQQAVRCALAMGERLHHLNQDWQRRGLETASMRVGIFTGPVVVGSLGGKDRLEYGVIGDSVNTAARLESCLKHRQPDHCRILTARQTLDYLQDQFQVEAWGEIPLKGKEQPVAVFRVIGERVPPTSEVNSSSPLNR